MDKGGLTDTKWRDTDWDDTSKGRELLGKRKLNQFAFALIEDEEIPRTEREPLEYKPFEFGG